MSMIFPGMDPYLEASQIWAGVHSRLVVYIGDYLQPALRPRYIAAVEERVYVEGLGHEMIPDVWLRRTREASHESALAIAVADEPAKVMLEDLEIHETYVEILDRHSGLRVVTVIEVVSPTNKYEGGGRDSYLEKQREVLASQAHLVEIDLLRAGHHVLAIPEWRARSLGDYDYLFSVNRTGNSRKEFELYGRTVRQPLPRMKIPLAGDDPDVVLDVQAVIEQTYDAGRYRERLDYGKPCMPPLDEGDQAWADAQIAEAKQAEASADSAGPRPAE